LSASRSAPHFGSANRDNLSLASTATARQVLGKQLAILL